MNRRNVLRILAAALVVAGASTVVLASPAAAGLLDCPPGVPDGKAAPVPSRPDNGITNFWAIPPGSNTEDPFAPDAKTAIIDQYGFGGLEWSTYDLGCGGSLADPASATLTMVANGIMQVPINMVGLTAGITTLGKQPSMVLMPLDAPLESLSRAVRDHPYSVLLPITVALIGLSIAWQSKRQQSSEVASTVAWLAVVVVSSTVLVAVPLTAAHQLDAAQNLAMRQVDQAVGNGSGTMAGVGAVHRTALYDTWVAGMLGDSGSPAAHKWGPALFKATTYSHDEWKRVGANGDSQAKERDRKQDEFRALAEQIKKEDPDAYANLQGKRPWNRIMHAVVALVLAFGACFFTATAAALAIVAVLKIRLAVVAWPAAAVIGAHPSQRHVMFDILNKVTSAVLTAVVFTFGAGVSSLFMGALMASPDTALFVKAFLSVLVSITAYGFLVHSRMKGMVRTVKHLALFWAAKKMVQSGTSSGVRDAQPAQLPPPPATPPQAPPPVAPPPITDPHAGYVVHVTERDGPAGITSGPIPALAPAGRHHYAGAAHDRGPIDTERVFREDGSEVYVARPRSSAHAATG